MSSPIKEVQFQKKKYKQSFFDMVSLSDLLRMQPSDHSQYEHHKLTFFVLLFITEGKGRHSINFRDYSYEKGSVFAIGKGSIHKFYPGSAEGYLLVFTEDFILEYLNQENSSKLFQLFNEYLASPKQQLSGIDFLKSKSYIDSIKEEFFSWRDDFSRELI